MKKYLLFILIAITGLITSCGKSSDTASVDPTVQAAADDAKIQAYIKANNITAIKDASGLYYQVLTAGTGPYPTLSSTVNIAYKGTLLDGTQFDSNANTSFGLSSLIQGWQIGIPKINMGGRILLLIPSALGYGTSAQSGIPANSVLVFTIDLFGFK